MKVGEIWQQKINKEIRVKILRIINDSEEIRATENIPDLMKDWDKIQGYVLRRGEIQIDCLEFGKKEGYLYPREVFVEIYQKVNEV